MDRPAEEEALPPAIVLPEPQERNQERVNQENIAVDENLNHHERADAPNVVNNEPNIAVNNEVNAVHVIPPRPFRVPNTLLFYISVFFLLLLTAQALIQHAWLQAAHLDALNVAPIPAQLPSKVLDWEQSLHQNTPIYRDTVKTEPSVPAPQAHFLSTLWRTLLHSSSDSNQPHFSLNFYETCHALVHSQLAVMCLTLLALFILIQTARGIQYILLGPLRPMEVERVTEQIWFTIIEGFLMLGIFREDFGAYCLLLYSVMLIMKAFHWLAAERIEWMEQMPEMTARRHFRLVSLLMILLLMDLIQVAECVDDVIVRGGSVYLLFGFEYGIMAIECLTLSIKYALNVYEQRRQQEWDDKSQFVLAVDLVADLMKLIAYLFFFVTLSQLYGIPLHLLRDLGNTFRHVKQRYENFMAARRAALLLKQVFPAATAEQLERLTDKICIVCREEMNVEGNNQGIPRVLQCGHILHEMCLRRWVERQRVCPTCRAPVELRNNANNANNANRNLNNNLNNNVNNNINNPIVNPNLNPNVNPNPNPNPVPNPHHLPADELLRRLIQNQQGLFQPMRRDPNIILAAMEDEEPILQEGGMHAAGVGVAAHPSLTIQSLRLLRRWYRQQFTMRQSRQLERNHAVPIQSPTAMPLARQRGELTEVYVRGQWRTLTLDPETQFVILEGFGTAFVLDDDAVTEPSSSQTTSQGPANGVGLGVVPGGSSSSSSSNSSSSSPTEISSNTTESPLILLNQLKEEAESFRTKLLLLERLLARQEQAQPN